jgi:hypothetical protein
MGWEGMIMGAQIQFAVNFITEECYKCGITFAVPAYFHRQCKEQGKAKEFFCPNGHGQVYMDGEVEKLRKQIELEKKNAEWFADRLKRSQSKELMTEYRRRAAQGQLTKIKKRVGDGVCPCCRRTFSNLQRHMHNQHPEFQSTTPNEGEK